VVELGPNTPAVDVIEAVGRVDRLRAVGVSVGSDAAEESAPRTNAGRGLGRLPGGAAAVRRPRGARRLARRLGPGGRIDADQLDTLLTDRASVGAGQQRSKRQGRHRLTGT
jgi:hypothetical protein